MVIVSPGRVVSPAPLSVSSFSSVSGGVGGMTGGAAVTLGDGADAVESPLAEWATTVTVYGCFACAPRTQVVASVVSQVAGPGEAIAVYPVTGAPPPAGASH